MNFKRFTYLKRFTNLYELLNFKGCIHLQRFLELEQLSILLLGVTTSTTQSDSLVCCGETVDARLESTTGVLLGGIVQIQYFENDTSLEIHESLEIYEF